MKAEATAPRPTKNQRCQPEAPARNEKAAPLFPGGYFPSFNIADAAITAGAIGLILDELLRVRRAR